MAPNDIQIHGLFYAAVFNGYLLLMMVTTSPKVWGCSDYSDEIKTKIHPQIKEEKQRAAHRAALVTIFAIGFP